MQTIRLRVNDKVYKNLIRLLSKFSKAEDKLAFRSYMQNGQSGDFPAELIDGKLSWYPNPNVRYIIWTNEKDQWYETGEFKRGEEWMQFFEMTLDRE